MNSAEPESDDLPGDLLARCVRDFGPARGLELHALMLREISPDACGQGLARLMRCILYSASGDEELLKQSIALCRIDYRDLIFGAEYENEVRVRDFNRPFESE